MNFKLKCTLFLSILSLATTSLFAQEAATEIKVVEEGLFSLAISPEAKSILVKSSKSNDHFVYEKITGRFMTLTLFGKSIVTKNLNICATGTLKEYGVKPVGVLATDGSTLHITRGDSKNNTNCAVIPHNNYWNVPNITSMKYASPGVMNFDLTEVQFSFDGSLSDLEITVE